MDLIEEYYECLEYYREELLKDYEIILDKLEKNLHNYSTKDLTRLHNTMDSIERKVMKIDKEFI